VGVLTALYMVGFQVEASLYDRPIIGAVAAGSPAEQAGLQPGDVILAIDGTAVGDSSELIVAIRSRQPGDTVRLTVRRDDSEREVVVTLGATEG
jgi:putative serine protease PepD